jgi:lysozyme
VTTLFPEVLFDEIVEALEVEEGFRAHAYRDTLDNLTIGYGRCIQQGVGLGLTQPESKVLLANDVLRCIEESSRAFPWFDGLKPHHQSVIVQLVFQMGLPKMKSFRKMIAILESENPDYNLAADELLDSRFARQQAPARAQRLAQQLCR